MWVLFAALSAALLLTCIWQRIQYRKLQKEINYISNRLETLSITSENGFVLLPTDHACMKKLGATINTLLQNFYEKKSEYEQAQKAIRHDQLSAFRLWSDGAFGKSRACRSAVRTITDGTGNHFPVLLPTIDA